MEDDPDDLKLEVEAPEAPEGVSDPAEVRATDAAAEPSVDVDAEEVVISLGDEPEQADEDETRAPAWVRDLRKSNREKDRVLREKDAEIARLKGSTPQPAAVVVGGKPTLEGCDYDTDKYEADLEAWHSRKREADEQQRQKAKAEEEQRSKWQGRLDAVTKASKALPVTDYDEAAGVFEDTFSVMQQGIIVGGPDDPKVSAQLRYALGRNPKKAKELAAITDPVKFTLAIGDLMTKLKVTPRRAAPVPETVVRSAVAGAAAVDSRLDQLRAEAAKTGDLSKVVAYKAEMRKRQAA